MKNPIAHAVRVLGCITFVGGFFIGLFYGNFPKIFIFTISGIISGLMMLGFSEIIELLDRASSAQEAQADYLEIISQRFEHAPEKKMPDIQFEEILVEKCPVCGELYNVAASECPNCHEK